MFIDGETGDFYGTNYSYQVADLVLRAFAVYVAPRLIKTIDVKKSFYVFYFGHGFTFFNVFFIFKTFFYLKKPLAMFRAVMFCAILLLLEAVGNV